MVHSISNSRVTTHNTCTMQEHYAYDLKLAPAELAEPVYRGVIGHEALAVFYRTGSRQEAINYVIKEMVRVAEEEPLNFAKNDVLTKLIKLLNDYFDFYSNDTFKVIMVEEILRAPVDENIEYGAVLDVLVEFTNGDLWVIDHKFVYNFKSDVDLQYDAQQPKYVKICRENGYPVRGAIFNQLRYREIKDPPPEQIFRRTISKSNPNRVEAIWQEQVDASKEIVYAPPKPRRVLTQGACKYCNFLRICNAELDGIDTKNIIAVDYVIKKSPLEVPDDN